MMTDPSFYFPDWNYLPWTVIIGFGFSFLLACGLGSNDCANSYGTSVGAGVLRLWQAYALATVFEVLGAALLGYKVTEKLSKGILNLKVYNISILYDGMHQPSTFNGSCSSTNLSDWESLYNVTGDPDGNVTCHTYTEVEYVSSALGTLAGAMVWMLGATLFRLPVSCTHATVGATVGSSLIFKGAAGIKWSEIWQIVISWISSPLMSGIISTLIYMVIKAAAFETTNSLENALTLVPALFWVTVFVNSFSILYQGSKYLHLNSLPWWVDLLISVGLATLVAGLIRLIAVKKIRKYAIDRVDSAPIDSQEAAKRFKQAKWINKLSLSRNAVKPEPEKGCVMVSVIEQKIPKDKRICDAEQRTTTCRNSICDKIKHFLAPHDEPAYATMVFTPTQILSSIFLSFTHGSNDTANAVAPLVGIWTVFKTGFALSTTNEGASEGIIIFGGFSMIVGLWVMGHKVIETVGHDITEMTPASGFSMELGSAFTVLLCSKLGIPVSTTHCLVGAVICVGYFRTRRPVKWRLMVNMVLAWVITLPVAGLLAALIGYLFNFAFQ